MPFMSESQRALARAIAALMRANPFLPEWIEAERRILGPRSIETGPVWHARRAAGGNPNVESELFGHKRGAFTRAVGDREGWLETCPPLGFVFLDEVAEITAEIQVKLLRVIQTRTFQRLGETRPRQCRGKLAADTNAISPARCKPDASARTSTTVCAPT